MPIYEYLCEGCGRITEVMQKMSDPAPRTCPECGSRKIAKLVSRTSFQLKGGGWYSDLYASKKKEAKPGSAGAATGDKAEAPATGSVDAQKPAPSGGEAKTPAPAAGSTAAAPSAPAKKKRDGGSSAA